MIGDIGWVAASGGLGFTDSLVPVRETTRWDGGASLDNHGRYEPNQQGKEPV